VYIVHLWARGIALAIHSTAHTIQDYILTGAK